MYVVERSTYQLPVSIRIKYYDLPKLVVVCFQFVVHSGRSLSLSLCHLHLDYCVDIEVRGWKIIVNWLWRFHNCSECGRVMHTRSKDRSSVISPIIDVEKNWQACIHQVLLFMTIRCGGGEQRSTFRGHNEYGGSFMSTVVCSCSVFVLLIGLNARHGEVPFWILDFIEANWTVVVTCEWRSRIKSPRTCLWYVTLHWFW